MSLALFFGVLVILLVLTVPICVAFAFVTLLPSMVDPSFPYTADAAVRSMVSGFFRGGHRERARPDVSIHSRPIRRLSFSRCDAGSYG